MHDPAPLPATPQGFETARARFRALEMTQPGTQEEIESIAAELDLLAGFFDEIGYTMNAEAARQRAAHWRNNDTATV